jgi:hypothetical protein
MGDGLTKSVALEVAKHNISVNAIAASVLMRLMTVSTGG